LAPARLCGGMRLAGSGWRLRSHDLAHRAGQLGDLDAQVIQRRPAVVELEPRRTGREASAGELDGLESSRLALFADGINGRVKAYSQCQQLEQIAPRGARLGIGRD